MADTTSAVEADGPGAAPSFGSLTVPDDTAGVGAPRSKFRIAIFGDFSGRASRGALESGAALAARKPMKLDIDTLDDVIARFRTRLVLPIGPDGAAVEVELGSIDDLHPDELYDNVELFDELQTLRRSLKSGRGESALGDLLAWGEEFGKLKGAERGRAKGAELPTDMGLSDFSRLIGGEVGSQEPTEADELIQRIVGPYVVKAPDPEIETMVAAVDEALSGAMRSLLHHPDFQAVEASWRSLDLLARRIETGGGLELVVYDVAAEELAADLAASDELSECGLFEMLAEKPGLDAAQGRLGVLIGLYRFEETPAHAELLGRMAKIAAYIDAPFIASISPKFLDTKTDDLSLTIKSAWQALRALPEAEYLGLASPRFLLRQPYGKRTDPIDPFDFEEFSEREGLKGMLWTNPAVLAAALIGTSWVQGAGKVKLGSVMTLDDIPFYIVTDQHGDQVALPCTERLITEKASALTAERGYMPVLSIQGRPEVRLGSFRSVAGTEIAGPWGGSGIGGPEAMRARSRSDFALRAGPAAAAGAGAASAAAAAAAGDGGLDDLLAGLDDDVAADDEDVGSFDAEEDDTLDDLLAGLDDDGDEDDADDEVDLGVSDDGDTELDDLLSGLEDDSDADEDDDASGDGDDGDDDEEDDIDSELEALLKDL